MRNAVLTLGAMGLLAGVTSGQEPSSDGARPSVAAGSGTLLIRGVHVFDAEAGEFTEARDILVRGSSIESVGEVVAPAGATEIDGRGKFALPGLFECHAHLAFLKLAGEERLALVLKRFVTRGIMAIRDVGGPVDVLQTLRQRSEKGELVGPELFYSGPMLEKSPLTWAQRNIAQPGFTVAVDSRSEVDRLLPELQHGGARLLKTFGNFDRDVYQHLVATAGKLSLPVTHDPGPPFFHAVPMDVAIACGVKSIEHGKSPWPVVLTDELQREHDDLLRRHASDEDQMAFTAKVCAIGEASVSEAKLERLIDQMLARDVFLCPTLEVFVGMADGPDAGEGMKEILHGLKRIAFFFTTKMVERGVKILVGQDGFRPDATFSEMRHLASCGLEPVDIIRGATRWPAMLLGVADRLGAITPGHEANILVLERDPLDDIGNMEAAFLVVHEGRVAFAKEGSVPDSR